MTVTPLPYLSRPIAIGRTAEVFAWDEGRILKLLRPGFPALVGELEAATARRVDAAGLPAPRFHGTTTVEGRFGLLYERLDGPSMLDRLAARPWLVDVLARRFADLHVRMHETAGAGLPDHRDYYRRMIDRAGAYLGPGRTRAIAERLESLAPGTTICHGDMHPGNVIMAPAGPIVIDWLTAGSGPPEADVARTLFLLVGSSIPGEIPRLERALIGAVRRRFARTYIRRYRQRRAIDEDQLERWRLPMLGARLGEGIEQERPELVATIDAELSRTT